MKSLTDTIRIYSDATASPECVEALRQLDAVLVGLEAIRDAIPSGGTFEHYPAEIGRPQ